MPRKKKSDVAAASATEPKIPKELLDQLITGPITQSEFETIYRAFKKAIIKRAMGAEVTEHLGYKHGEPKPIGKTNQRNGTSGKTVLTDDGPNVSQTPREPRHDLSTVKLDYCVRLRLHVLPSGKNGDEAGCGRR